MRRAAAQPAFRQQELDWRPGGKRPERTGHEAEGAAGTAVGARRGLERFWAFQAGGAGALRHRL